MKSLTPSNPDNLANDSECDILVIALLDHARASRRAKLAEAAAFERLEQTLLKIQRASLADRDTAPRVIAALASPINSSAHHE